MVHLFMQPAVVYWSQCWSFTDCPHTHTLQVSLPIFMSKPLTFARHLMTFVDTCKLPFLRVYQKWKENSDGQMSTGCSHLLLWLRHWGEVRCGTVSQWSLLLCHGSQCCFGGFRLHRHNKLDTVWSSSGVKAPGNYFSCLNPYILFILMT